VGRRSKNKEWTHEKIESRALSGAGDRSRFSFVNGEENNAESARKKLARQTFDGGWKEPTPNFLREGGKGNKTIKQIAGKLL